MSSPAAGAPEIAPRLMAALNAVAVTDDCLAATVGTRVIRAQAPGELEYLLAAALYDVLHAGRRPPSRQARTWRDPTVEARLMAAMPHRYTTREAILLTVAGDELLAGLDGVKVRVPRTQAHWPGVHPSPAIPAGQPPAPGTRIAVRVPAARPALSPGFFLAEGSRPLRDTGRLLRVYLHLQTPAAALAAWGTLLRGLEDSHTSYQAKVTSCPEFLPRNDALVVYLGADDRDACQRIADAAARLTGIGPAVSVFAEPVRPGVAIAWEPADNRPGMKGLSFGEHRCLALAQALIRHATLRRRGQPVTMAAAVSSSFVAAGIDSTNPARNLATPRTAGESGGRSEPGPATSL